MNGSEFRPISSDREARFVAAVNEGLEDAESGRTVDDEELGRMLDSRFEALPRKRRR